MSDKEKAPQDAVEVPNTSPDEQPEPEVETPGEDSAQEDADLKAELERERKAREKAEKAAAENAFKAREAVRRASERGDDMAHGDDEEDRPLTTKELENILARERQATQKQLQQDRINSIASNLAENEMQKELILEMHKNRSFPEHLSIEEQLEECFILANKRAILGENRELKRALVNKGNANTDASGTHRQQPEAGKPKMSAADSQEMARLGFSWNGTARRFEKKLSSGDTLVRDPKSGKNLLIKG